jgi:hypothetical protein
MFDKLEPSSQERWKEPIPNKLGSKSPTFLQRFIQNFSGYKGWRFICNANETRMRSSITFVVSEEYFGIFYDEQEEFKGNNEIDIVVVLYFWYQ